MRAKNEPAARSRAKLWRLEPHTAAKHEILRRYLRRWIPIMATSSPRFAYVDCFAGPGQYSGGEPGSPIVALDIVRNYINSELLKPDQLTVIAIEAQKRRYDHLVERYREYCLEFPETAGVTVELERGRYADRISDIHRRLVTRGSSRSSTFYLIDPCGVKDTPYDLLPTLLAPDKNEILFNLMYEETNRFMNEPEFEGPLDSMFGETRWRDLRQLTGADRKRETVNYFRDRLLDAGAKYVVAFEMRNAHNSTDYFLFFATKSLRGLEVMKKAMWEVDRSGRFLFSDYTYSLGPMLITPRPDYSVLQRQLSSHFKGRRDVLMAEIDEYVLTQTSFYNFKQQALKPMSARNECYIEDGDRVSFVSRAGTPMRLFES